MSQASSRPSVFPPWIKFIVAGVVLVAALMGYSNNFRWRKFLAELMTPSPPVATEPPATDPTPVDPTPTRTTTEIPTDPDTNDKPPRTTTDTPDTPSADRPVRTTIANQRILNEEGDVVFRGTVDVGPTLERIRAGERLAFPNDGSTFQNREGRLPRKPAGYYKEYVHPTPDLRGPGPQRIVMGEQGETYYTADHYRTFDRLDK